MEAVEIYARVFAALRPRTPLPKIEVEFCRFANVNSFIEWKNGRLSARISDLLAQAPASVQEALAYILLGKLLHRRIPKRHLHRYRLYLNRRDTVRTAEQLKRDRGRKYLLPAEGNHYPLVEIFEDLNFRHFFGLMARPEIGWSVRASLTVLGHYDSAHHAIVINKLLDRADVPPYVVEYIVFHEMLHLRYPVQHRGARRCVHTLEFRRVEEQYERLAEAELWIKQVWPSLARRAKDKP